MIRTGKAQKSAPEQFPPGFYLRFGSAHFQFPTK